MVDAARSRGAVEAARAVHKLVASDDVTLHDRGDFLAIDVHTDMRVHLFGVRLLARIRAVAIEDSIVADLGPRVQLFMQRASARGARIAGNRGRLVGRRRRIAAVTPTRIGVAVAMVAGPWREIAGALDVAGNPASLRRDRARVA